MSMIRLSVFVLLACSVAWPQSQGQLGSDRDRKRWADLPEQRNAIPLSNMPDPQELKRDADELAQLSRTIPAEMDEVSRGLISSSLTKRLKRIETLSKKLRGALERGEAVTPKKFAR
jgi:hypothetical protein